MCVYVYMYTLPDGSNGLYERPRVGKRGRDASSCRFLLVERGEEIVHHLIEERLLTAACQVT